MRKLMSAGLAGSVALTVGSCASQADKDAVLTLPPAPASTTAAPATAAPFAAKTTPLVPQVAAPESMPGLLQSTNSVEQARQVQRRIQRQSRTDPFASLPPKLQQPRPVTARPNVPLLRRLPTRARRLPRLTQQRPTLADKPKFAPYMEFPAPPTVTVPPLTQPRTRLTALKPKRSTPLPPQPSTLLLSTLPLLPAASLANAVEVSGVVVVGSVAHVIVKAPNETSSRHRQVGQRLANGQVLIKRLELKTGLEPIIILEENGLEVAKAIGAARQITNPA